MKIPVMDAQINWSEVEVGGVTRVAEVRVFDNTKPNVDDGRLENSSGAIGADWMQDPRCTPEGIYLDWTRTGFASDAAHVEALLALTDIEGLEWPLRFATALDLMIDQGEN